MKQQSYFYEMTSFTPSGLLFRGFFFILWSVWPLIYLMVLLESASVVGFAGKAPFHCSGPNRATAMLRSWLNRTSNFCVPPATSLLSSWFSKKHCALPHLYLSLLLLCFLFLNMMSVVQLWCSILEIQSKISSFSLNSTWNKLMKPTCIYLDSSAFAVPD